MDLECTAVGDRNVLERMLEKGYRLGGEQSGHMIFLEYATTGDGQLTALQMLALLKEAQAVQQEESALNGEGRVLVRPSGTEALMRVMVEAKTEEIAQAAAKRLADLIPQL